MARIVISLLGLLLCVVLLPAYARAQELPPRSYLFLEVANENGEVLSNATVRLSAANGKEVVNAKTSDNGSVQTIFNRNGQLRYDLQITKAGYLPYESVLFSSNTGEHYYLLDRLTEEMPHPPGPPNYGVGPSVDDAAPVRITLQANPGSRTQFPLDKLQAQKQLLFAVKRKDTQTLRKLLEQGVDPNSTDAKGVPAVAWATFAGDPETTQILLDAGADVRIKARTALLIYLTDGVVRSRPETGIIDRLIQAGADVSASDTYRGTVLNQAIIQVPYSFSLETIKSLIKAGANVNAVDQYGHTPLILASRQNQVELVNMLLGAGAKRSINARNKAGETALFYAAGGYRDSNLQIFKALIANGAAVTGADGSGTAALMSAAQAAAIETVKILLEAGTPVNARDYQGRTALMYAVTNYNKPERDAPQTIKLLLAAGAKIDEVDAKGQSALFHAVNGSYDDALVKQLIANGAHVNFIDAEGQTALLLAVQRNSLGIVKTLLEAGAASTINVRDRKGGTALLYAIDYYREEMMRALLNAGASTNDVNDKGETPLIIATQKHFSELVKLLLAANASVNIKDKTGNTALMYASSAEYDPKIEVFRMLIAAGADVNQVNNYGETPLMKAAAKKNNLAAVNELLKTVAKASINAKTTGGLTALMYAASNAEAETVAALLAAGANVHAVNDKGQTALMGAVARDDTNLDVVKTLLKAGAGVDITDKEGQTPLALARKIGREPLIKLLEESGARH